MPLPAPVTIATLSPLAIYRSPPNLNAMVVALLGNRKTERAARILGDRAARRLTVLQLLADRRDQSRIGGARRTGIERWRRVVLDAQLNLLGDVLAEELRGNEEGKIDSRRHAAAGNPIAVNDDALGDRRGAKQCELVERQPMASRPVAAQQPRGAEDQRARADRRHETAGLGLLAQKLEDFGILHQRDLSRPTGNADDVELRAGSESRGRQHSETAPCGHRIERLS